MVPRALGQLLMILLRFWRALGLEGLEIGTSAWTARGWLDKRIEDGQTRLVLRIGQI